MCETEFQTKHELRAHVRYKHEDGENFRINCYNVSFQYVSSEILATSAVVVRLFIDTQNRLVALHSALVSRLT